MHVFFSSTVVHEEGELRMKFTFMTKKGHKPQLKDLSIPIDSDLASNVHEAREALRDRHQEMKKLVLNYEQKQEEEEYLGEWGRGEEGEGGRKRERGGGRVGETDIHIDDQTCNNY